MLALANTMFKQHLRRLYTWTSPDGNTRNQIDYISIAQRWKTSLMNCHTYPGADCDTDHQLLVATLRVRLAKRQRQNSIPPLNQQSLQQRWPTCLRHWRLHWMRSPQKISGKVPRQSCWKWPEKRLDPSSHKRKRNGFRTTMVGGRQQSSYTEPRPLHRARFTVDVRLVYRASRLSACHIPGVACCIFTARC